MTTSIRTRLRFPTRAGAMRAVPIRTLPMRAVPMRAVPMRAVSLRAVPMRAVSLRAVPMRAVSLLALQFLAVSYLTALASLLFWSHAPELIGWQPRVVLTGSMMPTIKPGDVSVIAPAQPGQATLPKGRIVLVRDDSMRSGYYLHRVARYDSQGRIITKGDANLSEDTAPVLAIRIAGELRLVVPLVGEPVVWLQDRQYAPVVGAALATWAALTVVVRVRPDPSRRPTRRHTRRPTSGPTSGPGRGPSRPNADPVG